MGLHRTNTKNRHYHLNSFSHGFLATQNPKTMCVCFTLLEDFSTLLNHNLATTTTTCFCYSPAGVNIQEFSDLLLSYQSVISTVFDLLQIIIILLQKFSFFSKEGHVRGKQD